MINCSESTGDMMRNNGFKLQQEKLRLDISSSNGDLVQEQVTEEDCGTSVTASFHVQVRQIYFLG